MAVKTVGHMAEYVIAKSCDVNSVRSLIRQTIKSEYPKYYGEAAVEFFLELHNTANIGSDVAQGNVRLLVADGEVVATGSVNGNHISRVFVTCGRLNCGYGSQIMDKLEEEAASAAISRIYLETSVPAKDFYLNRDYEVSGQESIELPKGEKLEYEIMSKHI